MITVQQHNKICQYLSTIKTMGFDVRTYEGYRVLRVEGDRIFLEGLMVLSHKSYSEGTSYRDALDKFRIRGTLRSMVIARGVIRKAMSLEKRKS